MKWLKAAAALALVVALGLVLKTFVLCPISVTGTSMRDTLTDGNVVLSLRFSAMPVRGSIVECTFPNRSGTYIKRVIGLPGEEIEFKDGILYVDGRETSEPYVSSETDDYSCKLGEDEYLLLGDNRAESYDSRESDMGFVSRANIKGIVFAKCWPIDDIGLIE